MTQIAPDLRPSDLRSSPVPSSFRELKAWQRGHEVALEAHRITQRYSALERYNLAAQIRRSATSIPANIAEATGRFGLHGQIRFLHVARGSARELEAHLLLVRDLGVVLPGDVDKLLPMLEETLRLVAGLITRRRKMLGTQR